MTDFPGGYEPNDWQHPTLCRCPECDPDNFLDDAAIAAHEDHDYCPCCLHFPCCCQYAIDQGAGHAD